MSNSVIDKDIIQSNQYISNINSKINSNSSSSSSISLKSKNQLLLSQNTSHTFINTFNNKNERINNIEEWDIGSNSKIKILGKKNSIGHNFKDEVNWASSYFFILIIVLFIIAINFNIFITILLLISIMI